MRTELSIQILGLLRGGRFSPSPLQPCSHFESDRVAIGSRAWDSPALVLHDYSKPQTCACCQARQRVGHYGYGFGQWDSVAPPEPASDIPVPSGQQAFRMEFEEEIICCVGAVVLHLRGVRPTSTA